ncbi:MAG: universal stress protein [Coriobacteriales bacterium]|nr:universal stress protein [Coriobacteriales bacterium]
MGIILVGYDGTERGERALAWASRRAQQTGDGLALFTAIDARLAKANGLDQEALRARVVQTLSERRERLLASHPALSVTITCANDRVVPALVKASEQCNMIVMGSHHGSSIGETVSSAKGLRVSVGSKVPTVIVPADWSPDDTRTGVVVGIDGMGKAGWSVDFGADEAVRTGEELSIVTVWGVTPWLDKAAKAIGGEITRVGENIQVMLDNAKDRLEAAHEGLSVHAEAIEGGSPSKVLNAYASSRRLLVLGANPHGALSRAAFGSTAHSTVMNLRAPTALVPQPEDYAPDQG